jgi:hypothetical protein
MPSSPPSEPPDIIRQLATSILEYSIDHLVNRPRSPSLSRGPSSPPQPEGLDHAQDARDSSQPRGKFQSETPKHQGAARLVAPVLAGVAALVVQRYLDSRRRRCTAAQDSSSRQQQSESEAEFRLRGRMQPREREAQSQLTSALDSLATEVQAAHETIRELAGQPRPAHDADCEVQAGLHRESERLQQSMSNLRTSIHNIRNLEGGHRPTGTRRFLGLERNRVRSGHGKKREAQRTETGRVSGSDMRQSQRPRRSGKANTRVTGPGTE